MRESYYIFTAVCSSPLPTATLEDMKDHQLA